MPRELADMANGASSYGDNGYRRRGYGGGGGFNGAGGGSGANRYPVMGRSNGTSGYGAGGFGNGAPASGY